jgi:opacity protein-like surface antigen
MRKFILIASTLLLSAALASAQGSSSGNIFAGYSFENASTSALENPTRPNLQGWEASLEGKLAPWIGLVTDFSGHYGPHTYPEVTPYGPINIAANGDEYEALFGPRVSIPVGKCTPFAEVMVGIGHVDTRGISPGVHASGNSFATAVGGGLDYRILRIVALRVEGDYLRTNFFSTSQNDIRLSTGIVLRF